MSYLISGGDRGGEIIEIISGAATATPRHLLAPPLAPTLAPPVKIPLKKALVRAAGEGVRPGRH
jgi:hypothetical protein